eukprot:gene20268-24270_t
MEGAYDEGELKSVKGLDGDVGLEEGLCGWVTSCLVLASTFGIGAAEDGRGNAISRSFWGEREGAEGDATSAPGLPAATGEELEVPLGDHDRYLEGVTADDDVLELGALGGGDVSEGGVFAGR